MGLHVTGAAVCSPLQSRRSSRSGSRASLYSLNSGRVGSGRVPPPGQGAAQNARSTPLSAGRGVSRAQIDQLMTLEKERREALAGGDGELQQGTPPPTVGGDVAGQFARAMRRDNFSHWPLGDYVTDGERLNEQRRGVPAIEDRTVAIRPLLHPGPTNCSKNVVVRPRTAPAEPPPAKPPLLTRRPKTALARKVPEIEYALCWNMPLDGADVAAEQRVKSDRRADTASPGSGDSGVQSPRQAWYGPDSEQLADRLRDLQTRESGVAPPAFSGSKITQPEPPESGYQTPVFRRRAVGTPSVERSSSRLTPTVTPPGITGSQQHYPPAGKEQSEDSGGGNVRIKATPTIIPRDGEEQSRVSPSPYSKSLQNRAPKMLLRRPNSKELRKDGDGYSRDDSGAEYDKSSVMSGGTVPLSESSDRRPPIVDPLFPRQDTPSHNSDIRDPSPPDSAEAALCCCQCQLGRGRRSVSAPDLRPVNVATQTFEPQMELRCKLNPNRRLMTRPCRACQFYKKPTRGIPIVKQAYKAAFRAGAANYRPDAEAVYQPQSQRRPRLTVRKPQPRPAYATSTLIPPLAVWKDRGNDEYPERDRLKTTYGVMNRTVHQPRRATSFQSLVYK